MQVKAHDKTPAQGDRYEPLTGRRVSRLEGRRYTALAQRHWNPRVGLPFVAVMVLGEITAIPGQPDITEFAISVVLTLVAIAAGYYWSGRNSRFTFVPPTIYVASIGFLALADGGITSGLASLILVPIVWAALYAGPWSASTVVAAAVAMQFFVSLNSNQSVGIDIRRLVIWSGMGAIVVIVIRELRNNLARLATTDALTGLANLRELRDVVSHRGRARFAFLSIDIDNLKQTNDEFGHDVGDRLITAVAGALRDSSRRGEVIARTGGDEFVIFLLEASISEAMAAARRILETVTAIELPQLRPRVSVGVAAGESDADPESVLRRADAAMYRAKRNGGASVESN